ncbi:MAG: hypothetical protein PHQ52_03075 [Candidatus Omnitrophica bacterium]|nr:hypothetical protein [Candidatus Omnitrophota bacterium]
MKKNLHFKHISSFLLYTSIVFLIVISIFSVIFFSKSGDYLLKYLFNSMKLEISYDNNCNFIDAFIFKGIDLENVKVGTKDLPGILVAKNAHISFDYKFLFSKRGIVLNCIMDKPVIDISEYEQEKKSLIKYLPEDLFNSFATDNKIGFDKIEFNVLLYDIFAEVLKLNVFSKDLTLLLTGKISDRGYLQISLKGIFSKELGSFLPEEALGFLEDTPDGGYLLELELKNDPETKSLKIDSPRLKFSIGK